MQRYQQQQKTTQKPNIKFVNIGSSLIQAFLRSKITQNQKDTIYSIKKYSLYNSKRTQVFVRLISKIFSKKQLKNKKHVISSLLQNKISDILLKRQKLSLLKQNARKNSLYLISAILIRSSNQKISESFSTLKQKSSLRFQRLTYKLAYLTNIIKNIQRNILNQSLKKVKLESFRKLAGYKRCFILQKIYLKKRSQNILGGFNSIFDTSSQNIKANKGQNIVQNSVQQPQVQSQKLILQQLQSQHTQLQSQLQKSKSQSQSTLQQLSTQLTTLQQQLESIRFEYDLNIQDNTQLQQSLQQRQNSQIVNNGSSVKKVNGGYSQQKATQEMINLLETSNKRLTEQKLWKSVFDNLLLYLVKCQQSVNNNRTEQWSQQKLLQTLTQPLPDIHLYPSSSQLTEQNNVLKELLQTYKQAFPEIIIQNNSVQKLPIEIQVKQKRFLIRSLQCLSKWGTEAGDGLEGVKDAIQKIQQKGLY